MLEKLRKYEKEMSEMSKEISKVHILESQLDASKENFKRCCEREKKFKESNKAAEEKVKFLELEMEDISSRLLVAEQEALHEKANVIRIKEEWNEKTNMLHQAHETNVRYPYNGCQFQYKT